MTEAPKTHGTGSERMDIRAAVLQRLSTVIDPETGADVVRMRLIEDVSVDEQGHVSYTFRLSSPLCPIAVILAAAIKTAVGQVPGVTEQTIKVTNYIQADLLTSLLNEQQGET